ncbi:UNVERIFIED_CONTAM: hypothetical protein Scaly_1472100 [Sesamum calycinum]|uniref:Uncharacterized protein n=1 Tax=Sesamum calycinum TaxID=2727403 RepID=A0AAW2PSJ1_9LAMI
MSLESLVSLSGCLGLQPGVVACLCDEPSVHNILSVALCIIEKLCANLFSTEYVSLLSASSLANFVAEISSDSSETNFEESLHELENMIKDVGYRNERNVNKLVDYPGENDECSMVQNLEGNVADIIENSTNDEAEHDSIPLEPIMRRRL